MPGVAERKTASVRMCSAGCGTTVRVMEGDAEVVRGGQAGVMTMSLAKKLEGNPAHPVNQGTLCARGQAAIQITYHPDRITQPLKRTRRARQRRSFSRSPGTRRIAELVGAARRAGRGEDAGGARRSGRGPARARATI